MSRILAPLAAQPGIVFKAFDFTGDIDQRGALRELKSHDFMHVRFEVITIRLTNLSVIQDGAFTGTKSTTWKLSLPYNMLTETVFAATRQFSKLQILRLTYNRIQKVPSDAFPAEQSQLHKIDLSFNHISVIGSDAFAHLPNLEQVDLNNNKITMIGSRVFLPTTGPAHDRALLVNMEVNDLKTQSFRTDSLIGRRKLHLNLSVNMVTSLPGDIFGQIFEQGGWIDMKRNPLTCDCSFAVYLLRLPKDACINCRCSNGTSIYSLVPTALTCPSPLPLVLPCPESPVHESMSPIPRTDTHHLQP